MQRNTTKRNLSPHFEFKMFKEPAHKVYKRKANNSIADNRFHIIVVVFWLFNNNASRMDGQVVSESFDTQ